MQKSIQLSRLTRDSSLKTPAGVVISLAADGHLHGLVDSAEDLVDTVEHASRLRYVNSSAFIAGLMPVGTSFVHPSASQRSAQSCYAL